MQSYFGRGGMCCDTITAILRAFLKRIVSGIILTIFPLQLISSPVLAENKPPSLRFGLTPVILDDQINVLNDWRDYLQQRLKRSIEFIQRDSYGKITTHLLKNELDFGWICGYPYVQHKNNLKLVAVPLYKGKPTYHSYLIVPKEDSMTQGIQDLNNVVFAYSDPDSNSGYLYAQYLLTTTGKSESEFFKKSFFTWEHRNTVEAVAVGLAQAGIVDSYIWDTLHKQNSILTANTRIAHKSKAFAFPPVVAADNVSRDLVNNMRRILFTMHKDDQGRRLLEELNLDGFTRGDSGLFDDILNMSDLVQKFKNHDT